MKALIQRVRSAGVSIDGQTVAAIETGLLVLLGVAQGDTEREAQKLGRKTANLRIFPDEAGRFNRSALDVGGAILVVSQFTLLADTRRGHRPSFVEAAPPEVAAPLVECFVEEVRDTGLAVTTGRFGAHMVVALENDGPVTILLDTAVR